MIFFVLGVISEGETGPGVPIPVISMTVFLMLSTAAPRADRIFEAAQSGVDNSPKSRCSVPI